MNFGVSHLSSRPLVKTCLRVSALGVTVVLWVCYVLRVCFANYYRNYCGFHRILSLGHTTPPPSSPGGAGIGPFPTQVLISRTFTLPTISIESIFTKENKKFRARSA